MTDIAAIEAALREAIKKALARPSSMRLYGVDSHQMVDTAYASATEPAKLSAILDAIAAARETIAERNAMIDKLRLDRDRGLERISKLEIDLMDARAEMREERDDYRMKIKRLEEEQDRQYEENQLDRAARDAAFDALLREKNIDKGDC